MLSSNITNSLADDQITFLENFFSKCKEPFLDKMLLISHGKGHTLISTDEQCSNVYILLKGRLQAVEEYAPNQPYNFTELNAIDIVGDYELFTDISARIVTLTTLEPSLFLVIPAVDYIQWILTDAYALSVRIKLLISQIVNQTKFDRQNFFLDNRTRFLHFVFIECSNKIFPHKITYTHEDISRKLGCSLRTINRITLALHAEHLITVKKGKIFIFSSQYKRIKNEIDAVLHLNEA